jgi:hypothetical protein
MLFNTLEKLITYDNKLYYLIVSKNNYIIELGINIGPKQALICEF